MARESYNTKVEGETKERMKELTDKYRNQGLIDLDGDLFGIAAELLERNLTIQSPRSIVGIEELDQLTSRINRLFINTIEQNNTFVATFKQEHEEKFEKTKLTINSLIEEKQVLKERLTEENEKTKELTELTKVNHITIEDLQNDNKEKSKYIALLEGKNEENQKKIEELLQFEEQNKELNLDVSQKADEIESLKNQITEKNATAERQAQEHQMKIKEMEFTNKEALLNQKDEITNKFNEQIDDTRKQRDEFIEKYESKVAAIQKKYEALFAEKQGLEMKNQTLANENQLLHSKLDSDKKRN